HPAACCRAGAGGGSPDLRGGRRRRRGLSCTSSNRWRLGRRGVRNKPASTRSPVTTVSPGSSSGVPRADGPRTRPVYCITMPSKEYRQRLIAELVENEFISTQAEIAERLAQRGIKVTQATISRDVTELRLVRVPAGKGQHRYRSTPLSAQEDVEGELKQRFKLFV